MSAELDKTFSLLPDASMRFFLSMSLLDQLREKQGLPPRTRICPHCSNDLTVERTQYFDIEICENCLEHSKITEINACCSKPTPSPVKLIISNGLIQVRNQCKECGKIDGNSLGGFDKATREALPLANEYKRQNRQEIISQQYSTFGERLRLLKYEKAQREKQIGNSEWWQKYNAYLQTPIWKAKRAAVLQRDNNTCQCCLVRKATDVHHKHYNEVDFKGGEYAFDLLSLCGICHDLIHANKDKSKLNELHK